MQNILQHINTLFQQVSAHFPAIPPSMLIFFAIVAGFIALVIVLLALRILWAIVDVIFGFTRRARRRDPEWARRVRLKELRQRHHWERRDFY